MSAKEVTEAMSFYEWYESKEGQKAPEKEKYKRAAAYVKHVIMGIYVDQLYPDMPPHERRRVHRRNLAAYNHSIRTGVALPPPLRPVPKQAPIAMDASLVDSI